MGHGRASAPIVVVVVVVGGAVVVVVVGGAVVVPWAVVVVVLGGRVDDGARVDGVAQAAEDRQRAARAVRA